MGLQLLNLDKTGIRQAMLDEVALDIGSGNLYVSDRLSQQGAATYPALLQEAVKTGTDQTFAAALATGGMFNETFQRKKPKGGYTQVRMPVNAAEMLAEGEFNRFYIRGVCRWATEAGIERVFAYRAKEVVNPRAESEALIGTSVRADLLLNDLRTHQGIDTALGLPAGPNSGISVHLPTAVPERVPNTKERSFGSGQKQ